jgi:ParB family chromosome partitioning protein
MRRALGKGLSQLIADQIEGGTPTEARVDRIQPNPRQPRTVFDAEGLNDLAESIKEHGLLQPITVRDLGDGNYELIAGERRLRAAKIAGLATIPILVRTAGAQNSLELALIENLQREDIGPVESAKAFRRLADEFSLTQEQIAIRVGKSRVSVTNLLRLLKLPDLVLEALEAGQITEGHARLLLTLDSEPKQVAMLELILDRELTVRQLEKLLQIPLRNTAPKGPKHVDPNWAALQSALSTYLGSPARLERQAKGGKVIIDFYSDEDLQRIVEILGVQL